MTPTSVLLLLKPHVGMFFLVVGLLLRGKEGAHPDVICWVPFVTHRERVYFWLVTFQVGSEG